MRQVVLYIAVSLDGFIADIGGGVGWLGGDGSEPAHPGSYPDFIKTVDIVLLGYKTYHQIITELSVDSWPYEGKECFVFTHKQVQDSRNTSFTQEDPAAFVKRRAAEEGGMIWVCGGAQIVKRLMETDLIDLYCLNVMPIVLGGGLALFDKRDEPLPLRLLKTRTCNGVVDLWYERRTNKKEASE